MATEYDVYPDSVSKIRNRYPESAEKKSAALHQQITPPLFVIIPFFINYSNYSQLFAIIPLIIPNYSYLIIRNYSCCQISLIILIIPSQLFLIIPFLHNYSNYSDYSDYSQLFAIISIIPLGLNY